MSAIADLAWSRACREVGRAADVRQEGLRRRGRHRLPRTWDDLLAAAPAFKAKGIDVTNYWADPAATLNQSFYPLLWQAGDDVFKPDGRSVAFAGPEGVKALTFLKQLADGGHLEKDLLTGLPTFERRVDQGGG
ncbi:extracellular solute-binding protein [Nonomuraea dietziae]|uniref:extracellular solute-binding protein n=1 Tax=Nonomuraea dietziae TaxID=65515 RepID=UPI0033CE37D2